MRRKRRALTVGWPERAAAAAVEAVDPGYAVDLARRLVQTPSVVRAGDSLGNESAVASLIAAELAALGLVVRIEDIAPGRPNVIADWGAGGGPLLILEGHTDVVTEGNVSEWSYPAAFGGVVQRDKGGSTARRRGHEGRYRGRGRRGARDPGRRGAPGGTRAPRDRLG